MIIFHAYTFNPNFLCRLFQVTTNTNTVALLQLLHEATTNMLPS